MTSNEPGTPYGEVVAGGLCRPPADATGFSAVRIIGRRRDQLVQYCEVDAVRGWQGVEHFIRTLYKLGFVRPTGKEPTYAILDVINDEGDIIGDYGIPTAQAWRFVYRKLGLRVTHDPRKAGPVD